MDQGDEMIMVNKKQIGIIIIAMFIIAAIGLYITIDKLSNNVVETQYTNTTPIVEETVVVTNVTLMVNETTVCPTKTEVLVYPTITVVNFIKNETSSLRFIKPTPNSTFIIPDMHDSPEMAKKKFENYLNGINYNG